MIDTFLPQAAALLSEHGAFYMVVVAENRPKEIIAILQDLGLSGQVGVLIFIVYASSANAAELAQ